MAVSSPVFHRLTVAALLLLTFATGLADSVSVLTLGHVFVANMTGNVIFLGFWFVPWSGVNLTAGVVAFVCFVAGTIIGGRLTRRLGGQPRRWLTVTLGIEITALTMLSILAGAGVLGYQDNSKFFLLGGLAATFGLQNATARQFGIQELSTTVLTSTIVALGFESRLAGGTGDGELMRFGVIAAMCGGAVLGATLSRITVAPVFALAAAVIAAALLIFRFGPANSKSPEAFTS